MSRDRGPGPLLVAVWPGMGQVALTAGYYLMSKLHMHETDPLPAQDLFDVDQVDVNDGIVRTARLPRTRVFLWKDPAKRRDVVVLIGEAQPPAGKLAFCGRLLDYAERLGVREVYTFAAMADDVPLRAPARVLGVATSLEEREKLQRTGVDLMPSGRITGLNGVLLGAVSQRGLQGIGLLGEMPALMTPIPFAKASCAVLQVFSQLTGIPIELQELEDYGRAVEEELAQAMETLQKAVQEQQQAEAPTEEAASPEPEADPSPEPAAPDLSDENRRRIEALFAQAHRKRSTAFELKRELDRLGAFQRYEDRFLDLFRIPHEPEDGA
ncbi:MAG: PAC2 family protein [Planctomycetaceae bacterium]|nr:PAC2 family protein [Planctomycetaceae bacterium]